MSAILLLCGEIFITSWKSGKGITLVHTTLDTQYVLKTLPCHPHPSETLYFTPPLFLSGASLTFSALQVEIFTDQNTHYSHNEVFLL